MSSHAGGEREGTKVLTGRSVHRGHLSLTAAGGTFPPTPTGKADRGLQQRKESQGRRDNLETFEMQTRPEEYAQRGTEP